MTAPQSSTPVWPRARTTGSAKNRPTAINPVTSASTSMGCAPLLLMMIPTHCCGPNSLIAVSDMATNRNRKVGVTIAFKLVDREVAPSTCGLGKALPQNRIALITVGTMVNHYMVCHDAHHTHN